VKSVFVDTVYWIATVVPSDQWREPSRRAREALGPTRLVTTDEVLSEFLAALSAGGEHVRRQAARMVRAILENANVKVIPQSRDSFLRGLDLYEQRPDKGYSLTDCISMITMRSEGLTDVLTTDRHFAQEGFTVLIR
jgi:predicted nucleic acid-binding protein